MREKVSAPITRARLNWPVLRKLSAVVSAKTKPEQTAWMSKAAPLVMPRPAWILTAVAGKVRSGVAVAQMTRSMSTGSMPARTSACLAAAMPRSEVNSPSAAMWRCLMPVRSMIHSSVVSTMREMSALVMMRFGR